MGQLDEVIEDASRGRKIPFLKPDDSAARDRKQAVEEKFDKVNQERNNEGGPIAIPGKDEDMSP